MAGMFASMISMSDIRSVIMALYFVIIAAAVIGVVLLISILLSFTRRR